MAMNRSFPAWFESVCISSTWGVVGALYIVTTLVVIFVLALLLPLRFEIILTCLAATHFLGGVVFFTRYRLCKFYMARRCATGVLPRVDCDESARSAHEDSDVYHTRVVSLSGLTCPICLGDFKLGDPYCSVVSCGHTYHKSCFETHNKLHESSFTTDVSSCSICRSYPNSPSSQV